MTLSLRKSVPHERPVIGVLDSGLGLVDFADALHTRLPGADLVLAMDPDFAPYGRLSHEDVGRRALASAHAIEQWDPDAIVVACNTASVHALDLLRETFEPGIPIIGTVPAIKVAAEAGRPFAVWATTATTGSAYQRRLIEEFVPGAGASLPGAGGTDVPAAGSGLSPADVYPVRCPGLSRAIDAADPAAIDEAILAGCAATPDEVENIVLGCTHYGLVTDRILKLRPQTRHLFDSPVAVAAQTARRLGIDEAGSSAGTQGPGADGQGAGKSVDTGTILVPTLPPEPPAQGRILATYMSGRAEPLPAAVSHFAAGRRLLAMNG
jgi:glutamate racemase